MALRIYSGSEAMCGRGHVDPADFYPFFWGAADEVGEGEGKGYNCNVPLPLGADGIAFLQALSRLLSALAEFKPQAIGALMPTKTTPWPA